MDMSSPASSAPFSWPTSLHAPQPHETLQIALGKHPMMLVRHVNFFWDGDVQPVAASEQFKVKVGGAEGAMGQLLDSFGPLACHAGRR